ncbi:MAG: hypothetical protein HY283_01570 [Nitrospirae bacterium]|nr:hypothetical protein [Nitrospirota bacterium]
MNLDRFYATFIARDLFAKIVPGGILLLTVAWWFNVNDGNPPFIDAIRKIPTWGWLFVYGICYALGFAIQGLGELIQVPRWAELRPVQILSAHPSDETYEVFFNRILQFEQNNFDQRENDANKGRARERIAHNRERLVVIKEMAGNASLSSLMSFFVWFFVSGPSMILCSSKSAFMSVIILNGMVSLYWLHVRMRWRQRELELWMLDPNRPIEEHPASDWLVMLLFILIISIASEMWYFGKPLWCS